MGAEKGYRLKVGVRDVDETQTDVEAVRLQQGHSAIALLVKTRPNPENEHFPVTDVALLQHVVVISKKGVTC